MLSTLRMYISRMNHTSTADRSIARQPVTYSMCVGEYVSQPVCEFLLLCCYLLLHKKPKLSEVRPAKTGSMQGILCWEQGGGHVGRKVTNRCLGSWYVVVFVVRLSINDIKGVVI
jgi:hypothetical protein